VEGHADVVRAGERQAGEVGMAHERLADGAAGAGHVVEGAGREARVANAVGEEAAGPRRVARALEDDRVPGDERRRDRAPGEGEGEVEGRDHRPHPVGLEDRAVVGAVAGERVIGQDVVVVPVPLELVGVAGEEVGRLLRLAERLHAVLADLEGEGGRDRVDALLEEGRHALHEAHALGRGRGPPAREGRLRRGHGPVHVAFVPEGEAAEDEPAVHRAALLVRPRGGHVPAVEVHRVGGAQARSYLRERRLEAGVHLLRGIEHGGVRQLEAHGHSRDVRRRSSRASA
jgi:hypothetical protein